MNADPAKNAQFLLDLAHGKYNAELALADSALSKIGAVEPWALIVKQVLDAFVAVNRVRAPIAVMPGRRCGWVPTTNSRVGPDGKFL